MKKLVKVLLLSTLLVVGCSVQRINPNDLDKTLDTMLETPIKITNNEGTGYKYYLPRSMNVTEKHDFNEKLYSQGYYYYLYVDVIGYHNKVKRNFKVDRDSYFSKKLNYLDKSGYIEINKNKGRYLIEMMYNHAKVEVEVAKEDIPDAVIRASSILSSMRFNKKVVESLVGENTIDPDEKPFYIYEPKKNSDHFIDYVNGYDAYQDTENELPDNDQVNETKEDKKKKETTDQGGKNDETMINSDLRVY